MAGLAPLCAKPSMLPLSQSCAQRRCECSRSRESASETGLARSIGAVHAALRRVGAGKTVEEIVEAAVLLHDDHDVLDGRAGDGRNRAFGHGRRRSEHDIGVAAGDGGNEARAARYHTNGRTRRMGWARLSACGFLVIRNMTGDQYLKELQWGQNRTGICDFK